MINRGKKKTLPPKKENTPHHLNIDDKKKIIFPKSLGEEKKIERNPKIKRIN